MKRLLAVFSFLSIGLLLVPSALGQTRVFNHLTMNQWVRSTDAGRLTGRVILPTKHGEAAGMEDVSVSIASADGNVLRAQTDAQGLFRIDGVSNGVYSLTARGDNVFACCAMHVIDPTVASHVNFPTQAEIALANIDYTIVNTAVIRYMPPTVNSQSLSLGDTKFDRLKERICGSDLFRVAQTDGGMKGRIHLAGAVEDSLVDATQTNVFIFQDGMEIDRTLTNHAGHFAFANMPAGNYSLLAVGPGGVGLIGFELVSESEVPIDTASTDVNGTRLVGFGNHGCCCQEFGMQIAPMPQVVNAVADFAPAETVIDDFGAIDGEIVAGEALMDGCCGPLAGSDSGYRTGGGGYGAGGGGYGGGGSGALIGFGMLGAAVAVSADDSGNNPVIPSNPVSPAFPFGTTSPFGNVFTN